MLLRIVIILLFMLSSNEANLVEKYVELYQMDGGIESALRVAKKRARKRPDAFESQAFLAFTLQRSERLNKLGKGYSGLASKRIKMALKAFEKSHELIEHASSNLERGLLYVVQYSKSGVNNSLIMHQKFICRAQILELCVATSRVR